MVPILLMGISYGIMAGTVWNSIVYLVPRHMVGTVIGTMGCAVNAGLVCTPMIMGKMKDLDPTRDFGYYWVTRLSVALSFCGLLVAMMIHWHDT